MTSRSFGDTRRINAQASQLECQGCAQGLSLSARGNHVSETGLPVQACTAQRSAAPSTLSLQPGPVWICGRRWKLTMPPQADDIELALRERAMLRFARWDEPEFFIAPAGELTAGWVIGLPVESVNLEVML